MSQVNFDTSLDSSSILLNSTAIDDDPVAAFCNDNNPTVEKFELIHEDDKFKAFKDFLSNAPEDDYLSHLVFTTLKLALISEKSTEAKDLSMKFFREVFEHAKAKDRVGKITLQILTLYKFFHYLNSCVASEIFI